MKEKYFFDEFPILESERLILREITDAEAEQAVDLAVYDGFFAKNAEDVIAIFDKIRSDYKNGDSISWGIYLKATGELTGTCCFCRGYKDNIGEIGYVLKGAFRKQHIMTEAAQLITDFGLNHMKLSKVSAFTDPSNIASQAVLRRVGYKEIPTNDTDLRFEIE